MPHLKTSEPKQYGRNIQGREERRAEREIMDRSGFIPIGGKADRRLRVFELQTARLERQLENCRAEIGSIRREIAEERKNDVIRMLKDFPADTTDETTSRVMAQRNG